MTVARLAVLALLAAAPAAARDLVVAEDGSGDYRTLIKALKAATPGDVVVVKRTTGMVGLVLKEKEGDFLVESVIPGGPAEAAGVVKDDRVTAVDGRPVKGLKLPELVARLRGPAGTIVAVDLAAAGAAARSLSITRAHARFPVKDAAAPFRIARDLREDEAAGELAIPLAEAGLLDAQVYAAFAYHNGWGVKKDPAKSASWARKAAEAGDPAAMRLYGLHLLKGDGVAKDPLEHFRWELRAAEKGDWAGTYNVANAYAQGHGVRRDLAQAVSWYDKAAKLAPDPEGRKASEQAAESARSALAAETKAAPSAAPEPARAAAAPAPAPRSDIDEDLPPARAADPKAVAVVVGVERYRENLPPADFAAADARLAAEYFKRVLGVTDENLALLIDDRATKSDFEKHFERWLPNRVDKDSTVFVYFSGHGAPEPAAGDSYLVPYDGDPTYVKQTGYSLKRLYAQLAKLPAKRVVVAMDSCFSGAGGRSVLAKGARPLVTVRADAPPARVTVLSASASDQISSSYQEKGHGLFTYYLLKGLKEKNGDFKAAFDALVPEVERTARRAYNADQTPQWRQGP